jgi:hypothetical protein
MRDGKSTIEVPLMFDSELTGRPENYKNLDNYKNLTKLILIRKEDDFDIFIMIIMPDETSL